MTTLAMQNIFQLIFAPRDDHRKMQEAVVLSRMDVEKAKNRFEDTIKELLKQNDTLTGKANVANPLNKPPRK